MTTKKREEAGNRFRRGHPALVCGTWSPGLDWLQIHFDLAIWGAYTAIPVVLGYFLFLRTKGGVPFPRVFWLFVAFFLETGPRP